MRFKIKLDTIRTKIFKKTSIYIVNNFYQYDKYCSSKIKLFDPNLKNEFFDLMYHYVVERTTHHLYKTQNYVALYGYMRNISMTFCSMFWITILFKIFSSSSCSDESYLHVVISLIIFSFLGFISMYGFHKYKKRYTLEVLHAAAALLGRWKEKQTKQKRKKKKLSKK